MLIPFLLLACEPQFGGSRDSASEGDSVAPPVPSLDLGVWGAGVIDPLRSAPVTIGLGPANAEGATTYVEILDSEDELVVVLADGSVAETELRWDGRDADGVAVAPGQYLVVATLLEAGTPLLEEHADIFAVNLGLLEGDLQGERQPILWHEAGGIGRYWESETATPFFQLIDVLDEAGNAVDVPSVWTNLDAPPDVLVGSNLPVACLYSATPTLELTVGGDLGPAATELEITASIAGWTLTEGSPAEGRLLFTKEDPLAEGPRVVDEGLTLRWIHDGSAIASQEIPLRVYALLAPATFVRTDLPYLPWVAVIDPALRAIDGVAPDESAVANALVAHIFHEQGVRYDTDYGASYYLSYQGWNYDRPHLNLSGYLARNSGHTVNCSDCAGILAVYGDMLGVDFYHSIITPSFALNYIEAIGVGEFSHCPFGPSGCGFSYHAVVSTDPNSSLIYDATLALDGDEDPGTPPHTQLLVQEISAVEYMDRLVMTGNPSYRYESKTEIQ